ncbi:hypothetical protein FHG64_06160 [Antarcticibacterium flavum]|uniref:Uncharacterized protein n=1 Tax=Antarcticibacterium flavum TaxID=2058175 RepID=A0A5B7X313_9FLAO|nr:MULTISPECIES: hypothetical protein [Antarcticibacterium]QCY69023.1 hypothetical protein FHG64_06160 [Antarcticibacterium flavum]
MRNIGTPNYIGLPTALDMEGVLLSPGMNSGATKWVVPLALGYGYAGCCSLVREIVIGTSR